jgi:2'-5' RNA ligase
VLESALILPVPEVQPLVDRWRIATSEAAQLGAPAHVTLLFPWLPAPVGPEGLQRARCALQSFPPITLTFTQVRRWPRVIWLLPEPEAAVRAMTAVLMNAFPECPPYGGEFPDLQPHLTVAEGTEEALDRIEPEVIQALAESGPVTVTVDSVAVPERQEDRRWQIEHSISLVREAATPS